MRKLKSKLRNVKGITLVALLITVIILLILAGITISQLTGNGLFENTKTAKQEYANAQEKEDDILKQYENAITTGEVANSRDTVTISSEEYTRLLNASNAMNYSTTEEKVIGTWIDGKTIYKKVIVTSVSKAISKAQWTTIATDNDLSSVETVVDMRTIRPSDKRIEYEATMKVEGNQIKAYTDVDYFVPAYVIVEYTKTTPTTTE